MKRASTRGRDARRRACPDLGHRSVGERGQATVEFALVLPLVFGLLVLLVQIGLVGRDELLVVHAARDAAREATLTANAAAVEGAARRTLPGAAVSIVRRGAVGEPVEVRISYLSRTSLPLVGTLLPDITMHGSAVMRVERP
jgi:hypothetical protein